METVVERDNAGKNSFNAKTKRGLQTVEPGRGLKSQARAQIYIFPLVRKKRVILLFLHRAHSLLSIDVEQVQLRTFDVVSCQTKKEKKKQDRFLQ